MPLPGGLRGRAAGVRLGPAPAAARRPLRPPARGGGGGARAAGRARQLRGRRAGGAGREGGGAATATAGRPPNLVKAGPLYAGESVARIHDIRPTGELVRELASDL